MTNPFRVNDSTAESPLLLGESTRDVVGMGRLPAVPGPTFPYDGPAVASPAMPPASPVSAPGPAVAPAGGGPDFGSIMRALAPVLGSMVAARGNPAAMASGLSAFLRGKELRRAEGERFEDREQRRKRELAEMYMRAVERAAQFDDPMEFDAFAQAIDRIVSGVYELPPGQFRSGLTFNNQRLLKKRRAEASALLERLDRQRPDGNYTAEWTDENGTKRRGTRAELAQFVGAAAFDPKTGEVLAPFMRPLPGSQPNSPLEAQIADAIAAEEETRGRKLTAAERTQVRERTAERYQRIVGRADDRPARSVFGRPPSPSQERAAKREELRQLRLELKYVLSKDSGLKPAEVEAEKRRVLSEIDGLGLEDARAVERDVRAELRKEELSVATTLTGLGKEPLVPQTSDPSEVRAGRLGAAESYITGTGMAPGPQEVTKAELEKVAQQLGITYEDAKRQAIERGRRVIE